MADYGRQKPALERQRTRIDDMDPTVAPVAMALGACLSTCNRKHFARIAGLDVVDWPTN